MKNEYYFQNQFGVYNVVNNFVNDGVIVGVNDGIKKKIIKLTKLIITQPGLKTVGLYNKIKKSKRTIERYIKILK